MIYSDRSRAVCYQECHRRRWLEYEVPNIPDSPSGMVPIRLDMNLVTGSGFHKGVETLLSGGGADEAVGRALEGEGEWPGYWPLVRKHGLSLNPEEDASYVTYEQASLIEALVRAYAVAVLPGLRDRFEILEVEREEFNPMSKVGYGNLQVEIPGFALGWLGRCDALLLEKSSQDIYALSLKTTKEWDKRSETSARHDMQGVAETYTIDARLQRWHSLCETNLQDGVTPPAFLLEVVPEWFISRYRTGASPQVMGVKMEFAMKGRRSQYPEGSGRWTFSSHLIRPWKKADDLRRGEYAWKFEYKDPLGGNHRLGKGWTRINIWEDIGVKEWIALLASTPLQGFAAGVPLEAAFVLPIEFYRNEEDMQRWARQMLFQEYEVSQGRERCLEATTPEEFIIRLDEHFRMETRACDWPTRCNYQEVCFGPSEYIFNPMSSGLYQIRTPNHPKEEEGKESR